MAISPPGDIVLDVARAADPASVAAARDKLQRMASGSAAASFEAPSPDMVAAPRHEPKTAVPKAYVKFEGMVLQTFLKSMMPNDAESVYGNGLSGEMWKSMLAQTLGEAMARRGGIGIASRVLGDHYVEDGKAVAVRGISNDAQAERSETQDLISAKLVHELQRRTSEALDAADDTTPLFAGQTKT